jgi:hypothetical protein
VEVRPLPPTSPPPPYGGWLGGGGGDEGVESKKVEKKVERNG